MGKRNYTNEQLSAINTRDKTLLVSAAAGSGKTATLTERIIRSLIDDENPENINDMLIVTFTNAAVSELKERITNALKAKLAEEPDNARLERQIYMLGSARISTIDSFCNEILKNNTEKFGVSPTYRIADPIEAALLSNTLLEGLIEAAYNGELTGYCEAEDFEEVSSALVGVKANSALEEQFTLLYERTKCLPSGVELYKDIAKALSLEKDLPVLENRYGKYAFLRLCDAVKHYTGLYSEIKKRLDPSDPSEEKYIAVLEEDEEFFRRILNANSYEKLKDLLDTAKFKNLPPIKGDKSPAAEDAKKIRQDIKDTLTKYTSRYFSYSEDEWHSNLSDLCRVMNTVYGFLFNFDSILFEEKRRRAILEHSDVERLAFESLYDGEELSEYARSLRKRFSSVYVDEYQDVNALQAKIFEAVGSERNRFMVGDIKQIIYGFRSAKPEIFAKMKEEFPPLDKSFEKDTASIFMSKNFRCDKGIVDFVNDIFDTAFMLAKDSIGYVEEDRLTFGKVYTDTPPEYREPEIKLFDKTTSTSLFDEETEESIEESKPNDMPPVWVAHKIRELIENGTKNDQSPIQPSDIAIILRKDGGRSKAYAEALSNIGVEAKVPDDKDFFFNAEIELALCLLNTINNPMRDIYLAGLMCSPLYDFSADELFLIRRFTSNASLWESVISYSETFDFEKGKNFIKKIKHYRAIAEGMPVDALILRLYRETGILALAAKNGKRENLMLLYNYAREFEASSFEGLYSFINYVNTVIEEGASFSAKKESGLENAVTITTIHKSKGLEYPVVFIADAGASLVSVRDRQQKVPYAEGFGAAMRLRMKDGLALVESPVFNTVADYAAERTVEEELRVYYVALTRARERLYITGVADTKLLSEYINKIMLKKSYLSPYTLKEVKSFTDILLLFKKSGMLLDTDADYADKTEEKNCTPPLEDKVCSTLDTENKIDSEISDEILTEEYIRRFEYEYPEKYMTELPEKMSVSKLYPTILDGADEHTKELFSEEDKEDIAETQKRHHLPSFITGTHENESARRGIATHLVLQFLDIENLEKNGTAAELKRLSDNAFISARDLQRVRKNEIELFLKSSLFAEMKNAKMLYREFRFNTMLPAENFTSEDKRKEAYKDKKILLQGVIDCLIEDEAGDLHLVDYKTDRLTKAELSDRSLAEKKLSEKHALQLSYYRDAVREIFGKHPKSVRIYSLPLGDTVLIK